MTGEEIRRLLFAHQDADYRRFHARLIPDIPPERIIGVRIPVLRRIAKTLAGDPEIEAFLSLLPHDYYDEMNLHGLILAQDRDYARTLARLDAYLPHVDNWATCDLLRPRAFQNNRDRLPAEIRRWMASDHCYTVRFGIEMVMTHYLDEEFVPAWLDCVAAVHREDYYINMMIAWFFATALAKQWDAALPFLERKQLSPWVHNKTIQKAIESYRITDQQKTLLRQMKTERPA